MNLQPTMLVNGWHRLGLLRHHHRAMVPVGSAQLALGLVPTAQQPLLRSYSLPPTAHAGEATVVFQDGLPRFRLPLPSRLQTCQFTLKPLTNSVEDLGRYIKAEDRGVENVAFYAKDGVRIAGSNSVELLLRGDFEVQLNDRRFAVAVPAVAAAAASQVVTATSGSEKAEDGSVQLEGVKNSIAQLYTGLNVKEFELARESRISEQLEELRKEIEPFEIVSLVE